MTWTPGPAGAGRLHFQPFRLPRAAFSANVARRFVHPAKADIPAEESMTAYKHRLRRKRAKQTAKKKKAKASAAKKKGRR